MNRPAVAGDAVTPAGPCGTILSHPVRRAECSGNCFAIMIGAAVKTIHSKSSDKESLVLGFNKPGGQVSGSGKPAAWNFKRYSGPETPAVISGLDSPGERFPMGLQPGFLLVLEIKLRSGNEDEPYGPVSPLPEPR